MKESPDEAKEVVSIRDAYLTYAAEKGKTTALENINLTIREGEFICVLGPSGCGKSTLLNIIAGFHFPTAGQALMNGRTITGPDYNRGVVFQSPALYPWLSIYENVAFGPKRRHMPKDQTRKDVETYLDLVGLSKFGRQKPYELSGGMKQRASLARVLINRPQMILMDEPFGALDALTRVTMQTLVRNIWQKTNNTIFMITHDVDEALSLATRVIVMSARPGKILKEFMTDFTYDISGVNQESAIYTKEYMETREEILNIITSQHHQ